MVYVEELMIATQLKEDYDMYPSCRQQVQRCDNDMLVRHNNFIYIESSKSQYCIEMLSLVIA